MNTKIGKTDPRYFDDMFPDAGDNFEAEGFDVIKFCDGKARTCMVCNRETLWVEVNFEGPLCSVACVDAMWEQYIEALRRSASGDVSW